MFVRTYVRTYIYIYIYVYIYIYMYLHVYIYIYLQYTYVWVHMISYEYTCLVMRLPKNANKLYCWLSSGFRFGVSSRHFWEFLSFCLTCGTFYTLHTLPQEVPILQLTDVRRILLQAGEIWPVGRLSQNMTS